MLIIETNCDADDDNKETNSDGYDSDDNYTDDQSKKLTYT